MRPSTVPPSLKTFASVLATACFPFGAPFIYVVFALSLPLAGDAAKVPTVNLPRAVVGVVFDAAWWAVEAERGLDVAVDGILAMLDDPARGGRA